MDIQTMGETEEVLSGCQVRASQRWNPHLTAAFPRLEAWILSRPVSSTGSGPASEIASQAGIDDFEDFLLVSTPEQHVVQVLVVQAQNGANMASSTFITAPSTAQVRLLVKLNVSSQPYKLDC